MEPGPPYCGLARRVRDSGSSWTRVPRIPGLCPQELDPLSALQFVWRDDPGAPAGGSGDIARRPRAGYREGEAAADHAENAEARLHRRIDERAEHAAGPESDLF